jgi:lysophospholipase L1-like esterase
MYRGFVLLGLILVLGLALGAVVLRNTTEPPAPYVARGPGDTYLALGDSLAAGFTVGSPDEAYVARIAASLRELQPDIAVINLAVPGETSRSMLGGQLERALEVIRSEQAADRRVSPITIDIGGNDGLAAQRADRPQREAVVRGVETNLGVILDRLLEETTDREGRRSADIVVMNYYNPYLGDVGDEETVAYWADQLNQAIFRAAAAREIPMADVASAFEGGLVYRYTYIAAGDVHANADGHRVIAEQFWQVLEYPGSIGEE